MYSFQEQHSLPGGCVVKLSFAPMEGISTYIYRHRHSSIFGGVEEYFAPFIAPDSRGAFKASALRRCV